MSWHLQRRGGPAGTATSSAPRIAAVAAAVCLALTACSGIPGVYTVEKAGATPAANGSATTGPFNADTYVAGIWDGKVVPTLTQSAQDASTVLAAIAADPKAAGAKYGRQSGSGAPFTYSVKGSGTVLDVDTSGPVGRLAVDLAPGDGKADLYVGVGPAFLGTAVRDALPFIAFNQFTNQIDYADVATALNARVKTAVLAGLDPATAKGKKVDFVGAFAVIDPKNLVLTPVALTVGA